MDLHGGNIYKLKRETGVEVLDYSANINPLGLSEKLKKAICNNLEVLGKYPDPEYVEMKEVIAKHNGVKLENIIVGNGATEIMFLYAKVLNLQKVLIVSPTFAEYERAIRSSNPKCEINYFELCEKDEFILDIKKLEVELKNDYDLLVICNPNNPTGRFLRKETIKNISKTCKESSTKILLDEAFIEFVEGGLSSSYVEYADENVFIVRALTKFFAIPGLRLGYGITFDNILKEKIEEKREPWSVNAIAELATKILLEDFEYINSSENWIRKEKKFMYEGLEQINGIKSYKTSTNFILVQILNGMRVEEFREKMIGLGVLVRDASNFKFLGSNFFRLAIKERENNKKVLRCVEDVIG